PRRDLRPSTAAWLALTGLGAVFLLVTLFTTANYALWAGAAGVTLILLGYGWIVWLTSLRDPGRAVVCAVPPLTFYYLVQWKYAKLRPLWFVATGALLVALAALAPHVAPRTRALAGAGRSPAPPPP